MIRLRWDTKQLDRLVALGQHPGPALAEAVRRIGEQGKVNFRRHTPVRRGKLLDSWTKPKVAVKERKTTASGQLRSRHRGAHFLEDGGPVEPKRGKWIKLPTAEGKRTRKTAIGDLAFVPIRPDTALLVRRFRFQRAGRSGGRIAVRTKPQVMWILKKRVHVKGLHYIAKSAADTERDAGPITEKALQEAIDKATAGA